MTPQETTTRDEFPREPEEPRAAGEPAKAGQSVKPDPRRKGQLGSLDVWARSAPIRLAGYEDDLAEPHILPSVD